jgi:hypothetical protein
VCPGVTRSDPLRLASYVSGVKPFAGARLTRGGSSREG